MPAAMTRVGYRGLGYLFCESLTYRRPGNSLRPPSPVSLPTAPSSLITWGTSMALQAGTVSTTRTPSITFTSMPSLWDGWSPIACTG